MKIRIKTKDFRMNIRIFLRNVFKIFTFFKDLKFLRQMIEDDNQFLEVTALGSELAWRVMKLWMKSAGRTLNNYQESFTSSADFFADCTIILLFEIKSFAPRHCYFVYFVTVEQYRNGRGFSYCN